MEKVDINEILKLKSAEERIRKGKHLAENEFTIGSCFALVDALIDVKLFDDAIAITEHLWKTRGSEKDLNKLATAIYKSQNKEKLKYITGEIEKNIDNEKPSPHLLHRLVVNYRALNRDEDILSILDKHSNDGTFNEYTHLITDYGDVLNRNGHQKTFTEYYFKLPIEIQQIDRVKKEYILSLIGLGQLKEAEELLSTVNRDNIYRNRLIELEKMKKQIGFKSYSETSHNISIPQHVIPFVNNLRKDYPEKQKMCLVIMKFKNTKLHENIVKVIRNILSEYNIIALRADDKDYSDDLYLNVLAYIYSCDFAIAVFERLTENDFNPNVSFEVGYFRGLHKDVCFLKDNTLNNLQTDLIGQLYKDFDTQNPEETIPSQLKKWLQDRKII